MKELDRSYHKEIINFINEDPKNTTPIFLLKNNLAAVFVEEDYEKGFILVPFGKVKDLYLFGFLDPVEIFFFFQNIPGIRTLLCSSSSKSCPESMAFFRQNIRNIIYSFPEIPAPFEGSSFYRLSSEDEKSILDLPEDGQFMFKNYPHISLLLTVGVSYAYVKNGNIQSWACTSSMSDKYADISVYTRSSCRRKGYSYGCAGTLINELIRENKQITWTVPENNIPSSGLAEKLGMVIVDELFCYY